MDMIEHIFVVMLENRSFDQMLGFSDIHGVNAETGSLTKIDGLTGTEHNPSPKGGTIGVSSPAQYVLNADPGHEFTDVREQLCGNNGDFSFPTPPPGTIDPKISNSGYVYDFAGKYPDRNWSTVMECFQPKQLPVLTILAKEFAVLDHWFSSMPGPTWPNRFFLHAATAGGLDHSPALPMEIASTAGDAYRFDNGTIFDLLDSAKLAWTIYCGDEFPQCLHMKGMAENLAKGKFQPYGKFRGDLRGDFTKSYVFIEPNWHPFTHFRCGNSQHPLDDVTRGEQLLKEVYEAIRNSPLWEKSLLIITYDEHGGFFDHVAPPTTIDPGDSTTSPFNNRYGFNFRQLGVRVPAVVVSPYVAKGIIDHRPYEHCSVLSTIEKQFGLTNLTKRDKQASPLDRLLTLREPRTDTPKLPSPADSNVKCTALSDIITRAESVLQNAATRLRLREPKPIDPSISGFVHVALLRKLSVSATGEKDSVVKEALAVHSEGDALQYLRRVRKQVLTSGPLPG